MKEINVISPYNKEDGNFYSCRFKDNGFLIKNKQDLKYKLEKILNTTIDKINIFYRITDKNGITYLYKNNKIITKSKGVTFDIDNIF